ncbi:7024_t:CDS:1, partial [Racocetra persica]
YFWVQQKQFRDINQSDDQFIPYVWSLTLTLSIQDGLSKQCSSDHSFAKLHFNRFSPDTFCLLNTVDF